MQGCGDRSETEENKCKLIRGVMQHRCGDTIREQVHARRAWAGQAEG